MKTMVNRPLNLRYLCAIALSFALCACTGNAPKPQMVVEPENVTTRLAQAADRASSALDTLAAIEQTRNPTELPPLAASAPPELRRSMTVNWMGPAEPMVKQLADRASYRMVITGNSPELALIITINTRNQPLIETLRDIGLQLGTRAALRVDSNQKIIEINYGSVQVNDAKP